MTSGRSIVHPDVSAVSAGEKADTSRVSPGDLGIEVVVAD